MNTYSSFLSNIFMAAYIETQSLSKTVFKPTVLKCYIDDIFSLWDISKPDMVLLYWLWNLRPKYLTLRQSF